MPLAYPLPAPGGITDILPGLAFLSLPLRWVTSDPVTIYNLTRLMLGCLNGVSLYLLCRTAGAGRSAAWIGCVIGVFSEPLSLHARGHFSTLALFWTPLAMISAYRAVRDRNLRWSLLCGICILAQGVTSSRLGLMALPAVLAVLPAAARGVGMTKRVLLSLMVAAGAALGGTVLVYRPAVRIYDWFESSRSLRDALAHSVDLAGFFRPYDSLRRLYERNEIYSALVPLENTAWFGWGPVLIALGVGGALGLAWLRGQYGESRHRAVGAAYWLAPMLIFFLLSLGPRLIVGGQVTGLHLPWQFIADAVPPLATMRTVGRFAIFGGLFLGVACALLLESGFRMLPAGSWRRGVPMGLALLAVWMYSPTGSNSAPLLPKTRPLQQAVAQCPPGARVVHLPFLEEPYALLDLAAGFPETPTSIRGGLMNPVMLYVRDQLSPFRAESVQFLRTLGVDYVVSVDASIQTVLDTSGLAVFSHEHAWRILMDDQKPTSREEAVAQLPNRAFQTTDPAMEPDEPGAMWDVVRTPGQHPSQWAASPEVQFTLTPETATLRTKGPHGFMQICPWDGETLSVSAVYIKLSCKGLLGDRIHPRVYWHTEGTWYSESQIVRKSVRMSDGETLRIVFHLLQPPFSNRGLRGDRIPENGPLKKKAVAGKAAFRRWGDGAPPGAKPPFPAEPFFLSRRFQRKQPFS